MEVVTLSFTSKEISLEEKIKEIKNFVDKNILCEKNKAVLIGSGDRRNRVFSILVLNNIEKTLQWSYGKMLQSPTGEGEEKLAIDYFLKLASAFVYK
mgnify:CR=1 FL=1